MKGVNKNTNIGTVNMVLGVGSKVDWKTKKNKRLLEAFLALKNTDETSRFLRDLMTEKEIKEFANRLDAAYELSQGVYYDAITEDTGLSSSTIARIAKWLGGSLGGYRLILKRLHAHNSSKVGKGLSLSS